MSQVGPSQKCGYVDIKQSSKVRPRKLKSWKNRWVVLTKMSNLSSEQYVAKLDLYDSETKWRSGSSEKTTFVLENVTCIRPVKSKTHQHAFEIVESQPLLVMSGSTEMESYSWILSLQQIFTPELIEARKDCYQVVISTNEHSKKWNLSGEYCLTVSPAGISLDSSDGVCVISWGLNTLIRFNVDQSDSAGHMPTLVIECGPSAPTGQSCFFFQSSEAPDILGAIRKAICLALAQKQNARSVQTNRSRTLSATVSEKNFQKMLDNHPKSSTLPRTGSDSDSSSSTAKPGSPTCKNRVLSTTEFPSVTGHFKVEMESLVENEEKVLAGDSKMMEQGIQTVKPLTWENGKRSSHTRSLSHSGRSLKDSGKYSEVKDVDADDKPVSRRNTISCEPPDIDFDRLRSVSAVVATLKARNDHELVRTLQDDNDNKSDLDSAISSMTLSTTNEEFPRKDPSHDHGPDCSEGCYPCSLTRRRSSSTPDLQTFWKTHSTKASFENVYEELDELRASVQRLNKKRDSDNPPELPARPYFLHFTYLADHDVKSGVDKRKSFFNWHGKSNSTDAKDRTLCTCSCESTQGTGCCAVCRREKFRIHADSTFSNEKAAEHSHSAFDDINAIILEVQHVKRRRSSDITPVASSLLLSTQMPDKNNTRGGNVHSNEEGPHTSLFPFKSSVNELLIDLQERTDNSEVGIPSISKADINTKSETLISFFLDDENVDSKQVPAEQPFGHSPSYFDHLLNNSSSSICPQVSRPDISALTQQSRTWTWHGQNAGQNTDPRKNLSDNFLNPFEL